MGECVAEDWCLWKGRHAEVTVPYPHSRLRLWCDRDAWKSNENVGRVVGRVVVVQPYLPAYRVPFFDGVISELKKQGHECLVVTGKQRENAAARSDAVSAPWQVERRPWSVDVRSHHFRSYKSWLSWGAGDVLVLELAAGAVDTYLALLTRRRRGIALWGHVGIQTGNSNSLLELLQTWQMRRASLVFTYTERGRQRAIERGVPAGDTISLNNTVDMSGISQEIEVRRSGGQGRAYARSPLAQGKTFAYIGGLDHSKRIGFLVEALDMLWEADREIHLLVGGAGKDAKLLSPAVDRGQVEMLGRVGPPEKAYLSEVCVALLNPGRVGLLAAESFVLGLPIITTDWPYHAPEFEYLSPGLDSIVTEDNASAYAAAILELTVEPARVEQLRSSLRENAGQTSLQNMVDRFVDGCMRLLEPDQLTGSRMGL